MARVSVGGAASLQGTTTTPRPNANTTGSAAAANVQRAKLIAGVLFVVLVIVHAQREG